MDRKHQSVKEHEGKKYLRRIYSSSSGDWVEVDVYEVGVAFEVTCPAQMHALKKVLCAGNRGKGSRLQDLQGAVVALYRAIELEERRLLQEKDRAKPSPKSSKVQRGRAASGKTC